MTICNASNERNKLFLHTGNQRCAHIYYNRYWNTTGFRTSRLSMHKSYFGNIQTLKLALVFIFGQWGLTPWHKNPSHHYGEDEMTIYNASNGQNNVFFTHYK